jgi:hypothetical protein
VGGWLRLVGSNLLEKRDGEGEKRPEYGNECVVLRARPAATHNTRMKDSSEDARECFAESMAQDVESSSGAGQNNSTEQYKRLAKPR